MTTLKVWEFLAYGALLTLLTPLAGSYLKRVFLAEKTFLDPILHPVERLTYRLCGVDASRDQSWGEWTTSMLLVNGVSLVLLYGILRLPHLRARFFAGGLSKPLCALRGSRVPSRQRKI